MTSKANMKFVGIMIVAVIIGVSIAMVISQVTNWPGALAVAMTKE